MTLRLLGHVDLPPHLRDGGFDHAAVHHGSLLLYVAHTSNDTVDVLSCADDKYRWSIPNLRGAAGVLIDEDQKLVFTSNRAEDTVGILGVGTRSIATKVRVGLRPNGLAFDPSRNLLAVANVGDPEIPHSTTVSLVDVGTRSLASNLEVPGRTRWALFDRTLERFFVNIAEPAMIVVMEADDPARIAASYPVPAKGPHGLDIDSKRGRLFCACDEGTLVTVDSTTGEALHKTGLSGQPDVIFFNPSLHHLYVAVGKPGVIDVIDTDTLELIETRPTEDGAHTIAFDGDRNKVYAFLPRGHRAAVYQDTEEVAR